MGDLPLAPEDVAEIITILERTPYDRVEICTGRFKLSLSRSEGGWVQAQELSAGPSVQAATAATVEGPSQTPSGGAEDEFHAIRAPLPGTFYRAPQPGAPPFVEVGSKVSVQSVVGIIETMKLMTPVHAGVNGTVIAVLVDNAAAVDAQAALIQVRTDES